MSVRPIPPTTPFATPWLHRWIYYLAAGFMFAAGGLRALIIFQDDTGLGWVLGLMAAWLTFFILASLMSRRRLVMTTLAIILEAGLTLLLLVITEEDFFGFLFALLGMQAMQYYPPRAVGVLIGLMAVLTFLPLLGPVGWIQALALSFIYSGVGIFLASYIWFTRQAGSIRQEQQVLARKLQEANLRLEFHAGQQEQLAAGRERQRLARELHDSVTQTIFSMTLATQSALLLLDRDRSQVAKQLDRLDELSRGAMAELQELITRLSPQALEGGFLGALRHHLEERQRLNNLEVVLEVKGNQPLHPEEEAGLFRIAQEALNNVVKHAGVSQAVVRLHLEEPFWMEVEDRGAGFDPHKARESGRLGMAGMGERAAEIGWGLRVRSSPGEGTCIRVEKGTRGEENQ